MSDLNIKNALVGGVVAANVPYPTKYDNSRFTTPTNEPWVRVQILPIEDEVLTLGSSGRNRRDGLLRITVFTPKNSGMNTLYGAVDNVRATFKTGASLSHGGQVVKINSAATRQGADEDVWFSRIIDVDFYTYEQR
ncbi:MAG: hypothetical protein Tp136SUR676911_48 [Prokaryotic dsDNA virus sp.]|jgi:hypothetical protein|nr:MAG: hypothetical protein Tp136SUR676911_48 [Prokaryotic dsDNA virus sp.]|tara:strand:- start:31038 stop:31445 length:408 start_codon:yes stop_codon:yes gene_type:complete